MGSHYLDVTQACLDDLVWTYLDGLALLVFTHCNYLPVIAIYQYYYFAGVALAGAATLGFDTCFNETGFAAGVAVFFFGSATLAACTGAA